MPAPWGPGLTQVEPFNVRIQWQTGTNQFQTGFTLRNTTYEGNTAQQVADNVAAWVTSHFATLLTSVDRVTLIEAVNVVTGAAGANSPSNLIGTLSGAAPRLPTYVTLNIRMPGEVRKRYGQGGMAWPVRPEVWVDDDVLSSQGAGAIQGALDALAARYIGGSATQSMRLINIHGELPARAATPSRPARPIIPPTAYDVTSLRYNAAVSFRRSRKMGVGS